MDTYPSNIISNMNNVKKLNFHHLCALKLITYIHLFQFDSIDLHFVLHMYYFKICLKCIVSQRLSGIPNYIK